MEGRPFSELGLDPRILKALQKRGFDNATAVQAQAIPKALEGKDVVARAYTGSGKTLAYLLPAIHRILDGGQRDSWQGLVLVPTRELCEQVKAEAATILNYCGADLTATAVSAAKSQAAQRTALATAGQLVVSTPGRIAELLREGHLPPAALARLRALVLDESDLLLAYGHMGDLQDIAPAVPRSCQVMLMSATTSEEVSKLTDLMLHSPTVLDLTGGSGADGSDSDDDGRGSAGAGVAPTVSHYYVRGPRYKTGEDERLLCLLCLLKSGSVDKKVLIYCNDTNSAYRARLFLESFGVRCAMLNAELPLNSRHHILQQFNKGVYDYLIATDHTEGSQRGPGADAAGPSGPAGKAPSKAAATGGRKGKKQAEKDWEFGVTRGIDFQGVGTVINLDPPTTKESYVHRVGRTGRAGKLGTALSLLPPGKNPSASWGALQEFELQAPADIAAAAAAAAAGEAAPERDTGGDATPALVLRPYPRFEAGLADGLRYRADDVARGLTKKAIQEARAREIKSELLNSDRLKEHFEENPQDLAALRHDKPLVKLQQNVSHLKWIPTYLRSGNQGQRTRGPNKGSAQAAVARQAGAQKRRRPEGGSEDPLKAAGRGKAQGRAGAGGDKRAKKEQKEQKEAA